MMADVGIVVVAELEGPGQHFEKVTIHCHS